MIIFVIVIRQSIIKRGVEENLVWILYCIGKVMAVFSRFISSQRGQPIAVDSDNYLYNKKFAGKDSTTYRCHECEGAL